LPERVAKLTVDSRNEFKSRAPVNQHQDGHDKQDCESVAARRWLAAHGRHYARLNPVYLGDDLYSRQPTCQAVLAASGHFLFVCKPSSAAADNR
jgi:hypothetical protein